MLSHTKSINFCTNAKHGLQELQRSLTALNMARLGIQERDFLVATHERCEGALASHATSLTTELDGAAQEVTSLFDRQAIAVGALVLSRIFLQGIYGVVRKMVCGVVQQQWLHVPV